MSEKVIEALTVRELFRSPEHTMAWEYLKGFTYPWEALDGLKAFVVKLGETLPTEMYERREARQQVAAVQIPLDGIWLGAAGNSSTEYGYIGISTM